MCLHLALQLTAIWAQTPRTRLEDVKYSKMASVRFMGWRWRLQSLLITRSLLRRPQAEAAAVSETSPNEAEDEDEVLNLQLKTHEGWAEPQRECVAVLRKLWGGPAPPLLGVCVCLRGHTRVSVPGSSLLNGVSQVYPSWGMSFRPITALSQCAKLREIVSTATRRLRSASVCLRGSVCGTPPSLAGLLF